MLGQVAVLAGALAAVGAGPSVPPGGPVGGGWSVYTDPVVDLWFHGMALLDPVGPGPNALYDPGYRVRMRRAKEASGVFPTPLDELADRVGALVREDRSLDVFHFAPLYFAEAGRREFLDALQAVAVAPPESPGSPPGVTPRTAIGAAALQSVLRTERERKVLGEVATALEAEWRLFLGPFLQPEEGRRSALAEGVETLWKETFEPALAPVLRRFGLGSGRAILTPSLGAEGRILRGHPSDPSANILVVREPGSGEEARAAVFLMIREMAFILSRTVVNRVGTEGLSAWQVEALVSRAAVRTGALLLDAYLPREADSYRKFFLSQVGSGVPASGIAQRFEGAFPLEARYLAEILTEISSQP